MTTSREPTNLEELLDRISEAAQDSDPVSLDAILNMVGRRSFGPLLLAAGLITVAPIIGDIPGMPTIMGLFVLLIAVQLILRRKHFWLPRWLLNRSMKPGKLHKALQWLRPPARFVDRFLRPRLRTFTHGIAAYFIAIMCAAIALAMPVMEIVPFSANLAGAALTAFGLALIARDGLLALIAFILTAGTVGLMIYYLI